LNISVPEECYSRSTFFCTILNIYVFINIWPSGKMIKITVFSETVHCMIICFVLIGKRRWFSLLGVFKYRILMFEKIIKAPCHKLFTIWNVAL